MDEGAQRLIERMRQELGRTRSCACHLPALGHVFTGKHEEDEDDLRCVCGAEYYEHQKNPTVCPLGRLVNITHLRGAITEVERERMLKRQGKDRCRSRKAEQKLAEEPPERRTKLRAKSKTL